MSLLLGVPPFVDITLFCVHVNYQCSLWMTVVETFKLETLTLFVFIYDILDVDKHIHEM